MSVGSRHGHQQGWTQQADADDEAPWTITLHSVQSRGAPGDDTIHLDLETRFDVFDGNPQKRRQARIQIDLDSRAGEVIDDFYVMRRCPSLQYEFSDRLTSHPLPTVPSFF